MQQAVPSLFRIAAWISCEDPCRIPPVLSSVILFSPSHFPCKRFLIFCQQSVCPEKFFRKPFFVDNIADAVFELKDIHKKLLFYSAIRQYSNQRIAHIRSQTDRNILKIKNTILKKLRKKLYLALCERQGQIVYHPSRKGKAGTI